MHLRSTTFVIPIAEFPFVICFFFDHVFGEENDAFVLLVLVFPSVYELWNNLKIPKKNKF